MPTRTAVAGDDFDPRKLLALAAVAYTGFKLVTGRPVRVTELITAGLVVLSLFGGGRKP